MASSDIGLERLVRVYVKIRDQKADLATDFKKAEDALTANMDRIKTELLKHCDKEKVESVRTQSGTFMLEHECVDLLEKRLHQGNMRQFLEENPDLLPPGLNCDSEYTITVRRKK